MSKDEQCPGAQRGGIALRLAEQALQIGQELARHAHDLVLVQVVLHKLGQEAHGAVHGVVVGAFQQCLDAGDELGRIVGPVRRTGR